MELKEPNSLIQKKLHAALLLILIKNLNQYI